MIIETVADKIKAQRKKKKLSQEELALLMGVTTKTISNWESGRTVIDVYTFEDLAKKLGVSISELHTGKVEVEDEEEHDENGLVFKTLVELEAQEIEKSRRMSLQIIKNKGNLIKETGMATINLKEIEKFFFDNKRIVDCNENLPAIMYELRERGYIVIGYAEDFEKELGFGATSEIYLFIRNDEEAEELNTDLLEIILSLNQLKNVKYEAIYSKINSAKSAFLETIDRSVGFLKYELTIIAEDASEEYIDYCDCDELTDILDYYDNLGGFIPCADFEAVDAKYKDKFLQYFKEFGMPNFHIVGMRKEGDDYINLNEDFASSKYEFIDKLNKLECEYVHVYNEEMFKGGADFKTEELRHALRQYFTALR